MFQAIFNSIIESNERWFESNAEAVEWLMGQFGADKPVFEGGLYKATWENYDNELIEMTGEVIEM
jgi:hypothetical protein